MPFSAATQYEIAFKKTLGKAHTSEDRQVFNEPDSSQFLIGAQDIWAQKVYLNPADVRNAGVISPLLSLNLVPVVGTNNYGFYTSYYITVPAVLPACLVDVTNHITQAIFQPGDRVGQLIPASMGAAFQPIPYSGSTAVYPLDASDYYVDCFQGILTQQYDDIPSMKDYTLSGSKINCYLYLGSYVSDKLFGLGGGQTYAFFDKLTVGNGIDGLQDGSNRIFVLGGVPVANSEYVYLNGILLKGGAINTGTPAGDADYNITGNTIIFADNYTDAFGHEVVRTPTATDLLQISYRTLD